MEAMHGCACKSHYDAGENARPHIYLCQRTVYLYDSDAWQNTETNSLTVVMITLSAKHNTHVCILCMLTCMYLQDFGAHLSYIYVTDTKHLTILK